jgi:hypothetical protein
MKKSKLKIAKKIEKVEEKVVHTWGKFIERPRRTETLVCACGNRYIKTRKNQTECVPCMVRSRV